MKRQCRVCAPRFPWCCLLEDGKGGTCFTVAGMTLCQLSPAADWVSRFCERKKKKVKWKWMFLSCLDRQRSCIFFLVGLGVCVFSVFDPWTGLAWTVSQTSRFQVIACRMFCPGSAWAVVRRRWGGTEILETVRILLSESSFLLPAIVESQAAETWLTPS